MHSRSRVLLAHFLPSRVAGSSARRAFSATTTTSAGASSSLEIVQFPVLSDNYGEATRRGEEGGLLLRRGAVNSIGFSPSLTTLCALRKPPSNPLRPLLYNHCVSRLPGPRQGSQCDGRDRYAGAGANRGAAQEQRLASGHDYQHPLAPRPHGRERGVEGGIPGVHHYRARCVCV